MIARKMKFSRQEFTDRVNRVSYSPFNQYFGDSGFAAMDKYDDAFELG